MLALLLVALLVLVLLRMGALPGLSGRETPALSTFDVAPASTAPERSRPSRERAAARPAEQARTVPPPPLPPPPIVLPGVIALSREDFAASNVARIPRQPGAAAGEGSPAEGSGGEAGGGVPGPEQLFNAEWYRRPTRAEMVTYLPAGRTDGWGMIACRTVEKFRVEDCREIGETPGSGIARGLRRASWQFLVRPPRVGGRTLVGAWVRIRFDIVEDAAD